MHFNPPLLKKTRSTNQHRSSIQSRLFMSAILSVSLFIVTLSQPHVPAKRLFGSEIGREAGGSSNPADFEKGQHNDQLKNVITDLDSNYHLARSLANREDSPYFWRSDAFRFKAHSLEARDNNGRKISELSDSERVDAMKEDRELLRNQLESLKEALTAANMPESSQNAYELMDFHLKQLLELFINFFNPKKQHKISDQSPVLQLNLEMKWQVLIHHAKETFLEIGNFLLNPLIKDTHTKKYQSHLLKVQIFRLLNFFIKYKLIEEEFLNNWIQKKEVLESISEHIVDSYDEFKMFSVGLQEVICKSKTMEHLSLIQKSMKESDWKYIEFQCFKKKKDYLNKYLDDFIDQRLSQIEKAFSEAMFQEDKEYEMEKKKKCVEALIEYFDKLPFESSSQQAYYTYGLLQGMLHLVMRYHTDLFENSLEEKNMAQLFSLKLLAFDSAVKWLKSARNLEFVAYDGFWTTELDIKKLSQHIGLDKFQRLKFPIFCDQNLLGAQFDSFVSDFFVKGCIEYQRLLSYQNNFLKSIKTNTPNINYTYHQLSHRFGKNFEIRSLKTTRSLEADEENKKKFVAQLFLSDLWNWMESSKYQLQEFRKSTKVFTKIINIISSTNQLGGVSKKMDVWISNSPLLKTIYHNIRKCLSNSQETWDSMKEKIKVLNQDIFSSVQYSIPQLIKSCEEKEEMILKKGSDQGDPVRDISHDRPSKRLKIQENISGIEIPNLEFLRDTPYI